MTWAAISVGICGSPAAACKTMDGVKSSTFDGLAPVVANIDVQVSWGNPHPKKLADVLLIVDDAENITWKPTASLTQMNEEYDLQCYVSVEKSSKFSRKDQWQRAYDLALAAISDVMKMCREGTMPAQVNIIMPGSANDSDAVVPDRRENSIPFTLHVTARLVDEDA